ncbi:extracellular triacylglycerol lipase precursor [Moniliophthora roreri]|nr:extracellular triacylglycerol lipase precursor [Moniliophthora roreri]
MQLLGRSVLFASFLAETLATHVQLGYTTLIGNNTLPVLEFFGGIPYAEPPLGNLRFQPPILKPVLDVPTFNATNFGLSCLQPPINIAIITPNITSSEDCLTVNIYRPVDSIRGNRLLPVMVFIHGGGFLTGSSSQVDGNPLVLRSITRGTPVIYASLNYRLGPLGFPQGAEAKKKGALNLGLKDQHQENDFFLRKIIVLNRESHFA